MAKLSTQEIIDAIKELTVLELNDLVKACEEEFGVSAAAPVAVVGAAGGAAAVTFLPRPGGAFATAMAYFTFPVVRGHPVATGGFRSLAGRPRDFFLLFHNTSLLNVPVILQQCLKAP